MSDTTPTDTPTPGPLVIIGYDDAVNRLQQLAGANWEIGEIADRVVPVYGEETLQHLAKESGISYSLLRRCRDVFRAWPEYAKRFANASWSIHMIFATQPDRVELIRQKEWTVAEAKREVQRRKKEAYESWLRAIVRGLTARCAEEPPGSPLSPWTWEPDSIYDLDAEEDESGFVPGMPASYFLEDGVEADEEEPDIHVPKLFTKKNKKVGENVLLWNLPVFDTCPGKTMACATNCYANNDAYRRPSVQRRHAWNLRDAEADNFCERAIIELRQRNPRLVRIHSAGDFYTPEYTRKWVAITAALPNVKFWAYTRSWRVKEILPELVRLASLPNVRVWFSCDQDTGLPDAVPNIRACWLQVEDEVPPTPEPGKMAIDHESVAFRTKREGREPATRIGLALCCPTYNGLPQAAGVTCETCKFCFN
jgi:hypothetical protein